ncbi:hypothetical protein BDV10DRAFT_117238 [Aspergillus recurvatus]
MIRSSMMMISRADFFILLISIIRISLCFRCGCIWPARFLNGVHCLRLITCSKAQLSLLFSPLICVFHAWRWEVLSTLFTVPVLLVSLAKEAFGPSAVFTVHFTGVLGSNQLRRTAFSTQTTDRLNYLYIFLLPSPRL